MGVSWMSALAQSPCLFNGSLFIFLSSPHPSQNISPEELKMELPERQPRYPGARKGKVRPPRVTDWGATWGPVLFVDFETMSVSSYHRTSGLYTKILLQNFTLIVIRDVSTYFVRVWSQHCTCFIKKKRKVKISLFFNAWEDFE